MTRKTISLWLVALGLLIALGGLVATIFQPSEAEARPRRFLLTNGAGQTISVPGSATFSRTWDWYVTGADISAMLDGGAVGAIPVQLDAGTLAAGYTDGGLATPYQSSSGISSTGLGSALANQGVSLNGAWWQRNASVNQPGYSGNGYKSITRIIFTHEAGASGTAGEFLYAARSGVGALIVWAQSTTQFRVTIQSGTTYSAIVTAPQGISTGPHILDVFSSDSENAGANERFNVMLWLDGVYMAGAEHTSDMSAWTGNLTDQLAVGAAVAGASPLLGRTVFWISQATNTNQVWHLGYQTAYADCVALGLCPDMGAGVSRGTGRGLPAGYDGGTQNIVQPSGFIADGRTRTGWGIRLPSTYNPNVPVNMYVHLCGCSWTGASCRGSFVGGSAATADPQLETPDPTSINVYADSQYTDPTDCATAGGGNGWLRGNSALSDYQIRYIDSIIAYMRANFAVRATFCAGRSNGGAMCELLGAIRPDLFSGIQSAIGYLPGNLNGGMGMTATIAQGRTPVYMSHNRDDPTVPVNFARLSVPFWLQRNLGIDASVSNPAIGDGGFGWCISTDGGGANDGSLLGSCGCGATTEPYDSGPAGSLCCTWPTSVANIAALDGGLPRAVRYCEGTGGHVPPPGEGFNAYNFFRSFGEDAGG